MILNPQFPVLLLFLLFPVSYTNSCHVDVSTSKDEQANFPHVQSHINTVQLPETVQSYEERDETNQHSMKGDMDVNITATSPSVSQDLEQQQDIKVEFDEDMDLTTNIGAIKFNMNKAHHNDSSPPETHSINNDDINSQDEDMELTTCFGKLPSNSEEESHHFEGEDDTHETEETDITMDVTQCLGGIVKDNHSEPRDTEFIPLGRTSDLNNEKPFWDEEFEKEDERVGETENVTAGSPDSFNSSPLNVAPDQGEIELDDSQPSTTSSNTHNRGEAFLESMRIAKDAVSLSPAAPETMNLMESEEIAIEKEFELHEQQDVFEGKMTITEFMEGARQNQSIESKQEELSLVNSTFHKLSPEKGKMIIPNDEQGILCSWLVYN
jgi:hypothetical protein